MYFGVVQDNPDLPKQLVRAVLEDSLHPSNVEHRDVQLEILSDLRFSVTFEQGVPLLDPLGTLLSRPYWSHAAAAALSVKTIIEIWDSGRGYRQELVGTLPKAPPVEFSAPPLTSTCMTFDLDPDFFAPGAVIPAQLEGLELHGEWCAGATSTGSVTLKDLRRS